MLKSEVIRALRPSIAKRPSYWLWRWRLAQFSAGDGVAWRKRQLKRLRSVVAHAYERTEGYRQLYDEARMQPHDLQSLEDLRSFPFVTKELIRDNLEAFSVRRSGRIYLTTGGSTGIPFGFYTSRSELAVEEAFIHDLWSRNGWRPGVMTGVLRGAFVGSEEEPAQLSKEERILRLSSYYLDSRRAQEYVALMTKHRVSDFQAYPSSLAMLLDAHAGVPLIVPPSLERILFGSENVYDWLIEKARQTFPGVQLVAWYGHAERAAFAWRLEDGRYFAHPEYGVAELLRDDGDPCCAGDEGEIVASALHAAVTPFIRYRTVDRAVQDGDSPHAWLRVLGRSHEVLVTARGRLISMTAINMHDDLFDELLQFQFVQHKAGVVEFHVVPRQPLSESERSRIREGLLAKLGDDVQLELREVAEIPRTPSGKFRFLDQKLTVARHEVVA